MKNILRIVLFFGLIFSFSLSLSHIVLSETYEALLQNKSISQIQDLKTGSQEYVISIGETINLGGVDWLKMTLNGLPGNYPGLSCDKECEKFDEKANLIINTDGTKKSFFLGIGESYLEGGVIMFKFVSRENENSGRFLVSIEDDFIGSITPDPNIPKLEIGTYEYLLQIGQTINLTEKIKMSLLRLPDDCVFEGIRSVCDNNAVVRLDIEGEEKGKIIYLPKEKPYYEGMELVINFIDGNKNWGGKFLITIQDDNNPILPIPTQDQDVVIPNSSPVAVSPQQTSIEVEKEKIFLTIGEERKIAENVSIKLTKLMEVEANQDCFLQDLRPCNNFIDLTINGITKPIMLYKFNPHQVSNDLMINLVEKINDNSGVFYLTKNPPQIVELEQIIEEVETEESLPYKVMEKREVEESILISSEKITIYNSEKETETSYPVLNVETKNIIKLEIGGGKIEEGEEEKIIKEINIKPVEDKIILEVVRGSTNEDCEQYLNECKEGDEMLCQKYEFNCQNLEKQTCENYLLSCKKGNTEACQKWDLNCKKEEITTETCGKLLSLCQSGVLENCKEYNNSCQQKEITTASTKEELKIQNEKIYINEKEVKIMPDVASEKAIKTLSLKKEMEIELKDIGKPVYQIEGKQEIRVLGLFRANMRIRANIDGETGEIESIKKPWWRFLVF
jgi:hypothetical protein